jgi:hypothetical protein
MAVITAPSHIGTGKTPRPLVRATAVSSAIGLFAGLVLGIVTQMQEHDRG